RDAAHGLFELPNCGRAGVGIALHVGRSRVVEMVGERRGIAGGNGDQAKVELNLSYAANTVGAGNIEAIAARRAGGSADKMIAFVGSEDEQRVRFVDARGLQVGEKGAEGGVVVGELLDISGFTGPEGMGGAERCAFLVVVGVGNV